MNDLKFTTAEEYMKDSSPPEACYIIEDDWANDKEEENEGTMGRKISSKDD